MKKRTLAMMMAAAMALPLFAGCGGGGDSAGSGDNSSADSSASEEGDIIIGGLAPLTGNVSIYGIAASNGSKLYIDQLNASGGINGRQVKFVLEDEKGDPVEAVNAFNKLVENDKIVALIGDVTSTPSLAVAPEAVNKNIPMITPTGTAAEITTAGDNIFRACFLDPYQSEYLGKFIAEELGVKKAAALYLNGDAYSMGLKDAFVVACEANGVEVVLEESYAATDKDFRSQLTNVVNSGAEALLVPDYYNTAVLIAAQAREVGLDIPLLGPDGWDGVISVTSDMTSLENCYFTNHYSPQDPDPVVQDFRTAYEEAYGETPNAFAALGYDAAMILTKAIETAGSTDADAIVKAMKATDVTGVTGHITYGDSGDPQKGISIITIKNGEYELYKKY